MDDHKRAGVKLADTLELRRCIYTALRAENKRVIKRMVNRYARRKRKEELRNNYTYQE